MFCCYDWVLHVATSSCNSLILVAVCGGSHDGFKSFCFFLHCGWGFWEFILSPSPAMNGGVRYPLCFWVYFSIARFKFSFGDPSPPFILSLSKCMKGCEYFFWFILIHFDRTWFEIVDDRASTSEVHIFPPYFKYMNWVTNEILRDVSIFSEEWNDIADAFRKVGSKNVWTTRRPQQTKMIRSDPDNCTIIMYEYFFGHMGFHIPFRMF